MTVDAERKASWSLLRTAFKGWRDDAVANRIEARIDHQIVSGALSFWVVQQRGRLLQRVRDQRLLQEALEIWKERHEGIHNALEATSGILEHTRSIKLMDESLHIWREQLRLNAEQVYIAKVIASICSSNSP